jgi:hypothetical protein
MQRGSTESHHGRSWQFHGNATWSDQVARDLAMVALILGIARQPVKLLKANI